MRSSRSTARKALLIKCLICYQEFIPKSAAERRSESTVKQRCSRSKTQIPHQVASVEFLLKKLFSVSSSVYKQFKPKPGPEKKANDSPFCNSCDTLVETASMLFTQLKTLKTQLKGLRDEIEVNIEQSYTEGEPETEKPSSGRLDSISLRQLYIDSIRFHVVQEKVKRDALKAEAHPEGTEDNSITQEDDNSDEHDSNDLDASDDGTSVVHDDGNVGTHEDDSSDDECSTASEDVIDISSDTESEIDEDYLKPHSRKDSTKSTDSDEDPLALNPAAKRSRKNTYVNQVKDVECDQCYTKFKSLEIKEIHFKKVHLGETHPYSCNLCSKKYTKNYYLVDHKVEHHAWAVDPLIVQRKLEKKQADKEKEELVPCPHEPCLTAKRVFRTRRLLRNHIRIIHKPDFEGAVPFNCDVCGLDFRSRVRLTEHKRYKHKPRENFVCEFCSKSYKWKECLDYHLYKEHNQGTKVFNPLICDECGKTLANKQSLRQHKRSQHRQAFPYNCTLCETKCLYKSHLQVHMQKVHPGEQASVE